MQSWRSWEDLEVLGEQQNANEHKKGLKVSICNTGVFHRKKCSLREKLSMKAKAKSCCVTGHGHWNTHCKTQYKTQTWWVCVKAKASLCCVTESIPPSPAQQSLQNCSLKMGGVKMGFTGKRNEFLLHFKLGQLNHQSHIQRRIFTFKFRN